MPNFNFAEALQCPERLGRIYLIFSKNPAGSFLRSAYSAGFFSLRFPDSLISDLMQIPGGSYSERLLNYYRIKCTFLTDILGNRRIMPIIAGMEHSGQKVFIETILMGSTRLSGRISAPTSGIYRFPAFY